MTLDPLIVIIGLIIFWVVTHRILKLPAPTILLRAERFESSDETPHACAISDPASAVSCSGGPEGWYSAPQQTGWHNSVSRAGCGEARKETPEGWRVFKMPNYYGNGKGFGYGYGEPYYARKN